MLKLPSSFIFLSFLLALTCFLGQAKANDDWVKFNSSSEETSFLNFKTEVWDGSDVVSIWELINLENRGANGELSHLIYWTFNCAKRSYVFRQVMYYEESFAEGKEIISASYPNREFKYTKPGSYIDSFMRFMCKLD